jgi:2-(3-amino-3-carboxypropyl)histidine synthase
MEEDRAATNLGPDIDSEAAPREASPPKVPRKRFIGRRAAEERAAAKAAEGGDQDGVAGSNAVAGMCKC